MWALETLHEPLWQRLTWTLLHFLWQGLAVAAVAATLLRVWPVRRARNRYLICLSALVAMAACPLVTFVLAEVPESATIGRDRTEPRGEIQAVLVAEPEPIANRTRAQPDGPGGRETQPAFGRSETASTLAALPPAPSDAEVTVEPSEPVTWWGKLRQGVGVIHPYALIVWIAGVLALAMRLSISWLHVRWLAWDRLAIPNDLAANAGALGRRLGLRFPPRVCISEKIREAIVVGLWRPLVLVPASWLTEMTPEVLEAVIAHELAHIRRWDLWVNLLQRLVEMLLFYHPAVWGLSRRVGLEREMCTDELAVGVTNRRVAYATALEQLGRMRLGQSAPQFGASFVSRKTVLLNRVGNILGLSASERKSRWWPVALMGLAVPLAIWLASITIVMPTENETRAEEVPGDEADADRAAWGREVDGLQLGLSFDLQNRPYLAGETVGFKLLVRNNSAKAMTLIDFEPLLGWMPTVRDADGKRLFVNGQWDGPVQRRKQVVAPGETIVVGGVSLRLDEPRASPSNDPPHMLLEPGKYFVSQTYRFAEDSEATFSGELTSGELELTVAGDAAWGEATEGVRTRLRSATRIWGRSDWAHPVVRLTVDARNDGQHRLHLHRNGGTWQVEVDGVWYERFPNPGGVQSDFEAGRKYDNMTLELAGGWARIPKGKEVEYAGHLYGPGRIIMGDEYGEVLQLAPGRHRLRVAITLPPLFPGRSKLIRTVTNPIEIEIGPTDPTADSLATPETKHVGSVVPPQVEVRTEAPGLSAEEVESLVTAPLENSLSGTSSLQTISSKSVQGLSTVVLVFQHDTDLLQARQLVQERLVVKAPRLPAVARSPVVLPPLSSGGAPARDVVEKWLALIREGDRDDAARLMARGKNENADDVLSMTVLLEAAAQGNVIVKATHVGPNVAIVISKPLDEGRYAGQSFIFHLIHATLLGPEWRITEVSLVRPEEIVAQLEAFRAKPVDQPVNARGFGPMLERTVQRTSKYTTALDLDANRLIRVPNDFDTNRNVTQDPIKWLVVRGIDVIPQCNPNRQAELSGLGGMLQKVRQVENKLWDEADAAQVRKQLAASKREMGMQLRASDGSYPVTYVFETFPQPTGESRQGILQVLAVDQNEQAVKLRYQLVGALRNAEGVKAWPPDAVKAVFESLRSELVEIGADYPEFAGARDILVAHRELFYGTDYRHNCTVLQRGCRDDGPNAAYFRFEIYSLPKDGDPFPFATTPPAHRWPALNLVGWSNVYVGENSSPGVEAKVRDILRRHVAMIDHIASEPRENQVDIAAEELGSGVFGPVMERVVTEQPSKSTTYLDLDTGKYADPEPDTIVASTGWLRAHGVDLHLSGYESERTLRTTADMALRKLRDSAFRESSHWTVGEAQAVLRNLEGPTSARVIGTPCVFAFRTREGSVGIMQLLPPPEDKPEVTVRYKLLKKSKEADKFAIYLVEGRSADSDLRGDLSKLTLASKPILTLEDVLAVDATGGIYLRETARWLLFADSGWEPDNRSKPEEDLKLQEREQRRAIGRGGPRTLGQQDPYVLVLDGKRVLAGRIMSLVSSPMIQAIHYAEPARPVRIGVFDEQRKDLLDVLRREGKEMRWGEAVRSVQCGLRADRTRWTADEMPTLAVGVRNREPAYRARSLELELDGQWYQFKDPGTGGLLRAHIIPGELFQFGSGQDTNVGQFRLFEGIWQRKADSGESNPTGEEDQMRLTPGKHVIRVAFVVEYSGGGRDEPLLRALSNRAEIEIVAEEPLEAAATSTEAEGPSSKTAAPPAPSEKSAVPPARFTPVMQRIIWIGSSDSFMLDLDTGKTRGKPKAPETGHGMDIWPDRDEAEMGPYDVVCRGVKGVVVSSDQWDVTPAELIRTLSDPNLKDLPRITHNSKEVTTAFVKTSEGGMGVLKLHGAIAAGDLPDRPMIFYRMLVDDRPKAGWGPPADGVQARLRATKRTWKAGEPPSLEVDLENTGSRPLSFPRNYTYWHLQVDGRWYVHRLGGSGSELPNLFGGDHYEKLPLSFAGDWRLAEKEEIGPNYRSGFHTRIPDDRPRLKLAAGKHTVRVAVTAESARASTGGPLWIESNPVDIEIASGDPVADAEKAAAPSAEANVSRPPASPQDAKALLRQLNSGTLSDDQIRQITDEALAIQGDLKQEWDPVWGNWLEVARLQGNVSDADFERHAKQSNPVWQLDAKEGMEKRSGRIGLGFNLRHVGGRVTSQTTNHGLIMTHRFDGLRIDDVPIDWRERGEWTFTAGAGHGSAIFREPREIQGIENLIPGKHEAVLLIEGEIYEADRPKKILHRWKATLKDEIELDRMLMPRNSTDDG